MTPFATPEGQAPVAPGAPDATAGGFPPPTWGADGGPTDEQIQGLLQPAVSDEAQIREVLGVRDPASDPAADPAGDVPTTPPTPDGALSRTGAFSTPETSTAVERDPAFAASSAPDWSGLTAPPAPTPEEQPPMSPEEEAQMLEARGPEYQATQAVISQHERDRADAAKRVDAATANVQRADENYLSYQKATAAAKTEHAKLRAAVQALGEQRIDNDRWWSDRSTGQKVAGYVGAMISGALDPTGPNSTLDLIERQIDRDISTQKANLAHQSANLQQQQGLVGEMFAQTGDEFQAAEGARMASFQALDQQLAAEQAQYDTEGTLGLRIAEARQAVRARIAEQDAALEEQQWRRQIEGHKMRMAERTLDQRDLESRRSTGLGYANLRDRQEQRDFEADMQAKKDDQAQLDKEIEKVETRGIGGLITKDGKQFVARDKTTAAMLSKKKAAVDDVTRILNRAIRARDKYGWSSDLMRSDEWREAQSDLGTVTLQAAQGIYDLGAISEADQELVSKIIGTSDFTEMRDPRAGMTRARDNFVNSFNSTLEAQPDWSGRYEPEDPEEEAARSSETRDIQDRIMTERYGYTIEGMDQAYQRYQAERQSADQAPLAFDQWAEIERERKEQLDESLRQGRGEPPAIDVFPGQGRSDREFQERVRSTVPPLGLSERE
jgi:hypothetical protein